MLHKHVAAAGGVKASEGSPLLLLLVALRDEDEQIRQLGELAGEADNGEKKLR